MTQTPYTLEDLAAAKAELGRLERAWDNYSGNNPNKYRSRIETARVRVSAIKLHLKAAGQQLPD